MGPQLRAARAHCSLSPLRMNAAEPVATAKLTFTQEMRAKAMSLHTFSQAPKEGKKKDTKETQVVNWETTKEDFLQFLTDSLVVYEAMEVAVQKPGLELLVNSGLERVEGLKKDIAFIQSTYGLATPTPSAAATEYAGFLKNIKEDGVFVVHFYNYYFAHTAGGRMIGQKVMDEVFGGTCLNSTSGTATSRRSSPRSRGRSTSSPTPGLGSRRTHRWLPRPRLSRSPARSFACWWARPATVPRG